MRFESIAEAVGRTPLVRLKNVEREYGLRAKLFVKVESMNPVGSVKDRVAARGGGKRKIERGYDAHRADERQHGDRAGGACRGERV